MEADLSAEEFCRLQEELMALKIQIHDLVEGNRRARQQLEATSNFEAQLSSSGAPSTAKTATAAAEGAAALGRLAKKASVGAGAMSALGFRKAAEIKATFGNQDQPPTMPPPSAAPNDLDGVDDDEVEALRSEVDSLRIRLSATLEELSEARRAALAAQQAAVAAAAGQPTATSAADGAAEVAPPVDVVELRQRLHAARPDRWEAAEDATTNNVIDDELLSQISHAALELAGPAALSSVRDPGAKTGGSGAGAGNKSGGKPTAPEDGADFLMGALLKIQKQQKDLEKMREKVDEQSSQINRLTEYVSAQVEPAGDGVRPVESKVPPEERLRAAEKQKEELGRRLETSEGASRHLYELQCHMQVLADRVQHKERAIEATLATQEAHEIAHKVLRERLCFAEEDLASFIHESLKSQGDDHEHPHGASGEARPDVASVASTDVALHVRSGGASGSPDSRASADRGFWSVGVEADMPLEIDGEKLDAVCHRLRDELAALQAEKAEIEQSTAQEAKELRAAIRGAQANASAVVKTSSLTARRSSVPVVEPEDLGDEDTIGTLYVQKIEELEALSVGLENDLELLRSSEQVLTDDIREKEGLISFLMRQVRSAEMVSDALDMGRPVSKSGAPAPGQPTLGNFLGALPAAIRGIGGGHAEDDARLDELEREAQEAMHDNSRLRNDLRVFAEELRKALVEHAKYTEGTVGDD